MSLRYKMSYRDVLKCGCDNECAYCQDYGHSACWRKVAVWRRLWILLKERKDEIGNARSRRGS